MGCVKALKYDRILDQIITVDSTNIQTNGNYGLIHIPPQDSIYIMAFENDEAQLVFVRLIIHLQRIGRMPWYYTRPVICQI